MEFVLEEPRGVVPQPTGDALDGPQCHVAFASLQATDVGPMDAEQIGESLLAQALGEPARPEVAAKSVLQVPFHNPNRGYLLLLGLHTHQ
jgi:hypothetical protein